MRGLESDTAAEAEQVPRSARRIARGKREVGRNRRWRPRTRRGASSSGAESLRSGQEILRSLAEIGFRSRLLTEPAELAVFASDALTAFRQLPLAVVIPETRDEVVAAVSACSEHAIPFVARGSGTSLSGGSLPVEGGIVIALNRLNEILDIDPESRTARVQSGVVNLALSRAAAGHGLAYAPDPSSESVCTIGGNIAFNSGGAHCLKHGMTANHVLGIEAVLPDGVVVELGDDSTETAGPDWVGMFCGSEGLFGIALEMTVGLIPLPELTETSLAAYGSLEAAGEAVAQIIEAGILPVAIEMMDALAIEAAEAAVKPGYPDAAALLIVELAGEHDVVRADASQLTDLLRTSGAAEVLRSRQPDEQSLIWRGRKSAFSAVGWLAPDYIVQDGVVPRTRLGEALAEIERMSRDSGMQIANVFHAGDGNLHPIILFDARRQGALQAAERLAGEILQMCVSLGGSITGEHGVGVEKLQHMQLMFSEQDLEVMQRLRASIDPAQIANRGKMLPWPPEDERRMGLSPPEDERRTGLWPPEDERRQRLRAPDAARKRGGRDDGASTPPRLDGRSAGTAATRRSAGVAKEIERLQDAVRSLPKLLPVGGRSKPALSCSAAGGAQLLDISHLSGILDYDPAELTLTALAGTQVAEVDALLAEHGQWLPFDPPLAAAGATLGGAVAAGVSGCSAHLHGGVRDFVLGIELIDGTGAVVRGGGRVVKNAAGFDLPKLLVGSIGRLGVITRLSLKVLPRPEAAITILAHPDDRAQALTALACLGRAPVEILALDAEPEGRLLVRLGGRRADLRARAARCAALLNMPSRCAEDAEDAALWSDAARFSWVDESELLVRVAMHLGSTPALEQALAGRGAKLRLSLGGKAAIIGWPQSRPLSELDLLLRTIGLRAIVLRGASGGSRAAIPPLLGGSAARAGGETASGTAAGIGSGASGSCPAAGGGAFGERIRRALDPVERFLPLR